MTYKPDVSTVIGGKGYIGRHLVGYLRNSGRPYWAPEKNDPDLLKRELGTVFYCVGLTSDFRTRPFATVDAHIVLLRQILEHANFRRLVYLSSTRVYVDADSTCEDQPLRVRPDDPEDLYKLSKLMGESLCLHSGRDCVVARLSNVVGGAGGNPDTFIYSLLREAASGRVLLNSHPDSEKDYIRIEDVVVLLDKIGSHGQHRIYNVASGRQVTHRQWLDTVCGLTGAHWEVFNDPPVNKFAPIDINRIVGEFGFKARDPIDGIIEFLTTRGGDK